MAANPSQADLVWLEFFHEQRRQAMQSTSKDKGPQEDDGDSLHGDNDASIQGDQKGADGLGSKGGSEGIGWWDGGKTGHDGCSGRNGPRDGYDEGNDGRRSWHDSDYASGQGGQGGACGASTDDDPGTYRRKTIRPNGNSRTHKKKVPLHLHHVPVCSAAKTRRDAERLKLRRLRKVFREY